VHSDINKSRFAPILLTKSPIKVSVFRTGVTVGATDPSIVGKCEGDVDEGNGEGRVVVGFFEGLRVGVPVDGVIVGVIVGCIAEGATVGFTVGTDVVGEFDGKNVGFVEGSLALGEVVGSVDGPLVGIFDGA